MFNVQNRFTGNEDVPLTLKGGHEAFLAAKSLLETGICFQDAFCSKLLRTRQSLKTILKVIDGHKKDITL